MSKYFFKLKVSYDVNLYFSANSGHHSYQSPSYRSREPYRGPYGRSGGYNRGYRYVQ